MIPCIGKLFAGLSNAHVISCGNTKSGGTYARARSQARRILRSVDRRAWMAMVSGLTAGIW